MIQILRLLRGYIEFCAEGGFPERFINLCKINGINLWNVKNDGVKVYACTTTKEFEMIYLAAENSGMAIKTEKIRGLKHFSMSHKWRCGACLGIISAFLFWFFMSGFIWEIEIIETNGVNVEAFTESLEELGVKIGARKSKIDIIQVQNQLMNEYKELLWVSLNIFGGKVQVEMSEFIEQKEITDTKKPINLVASKKGQITLVKGYKGVNEVKEGDNVTEGALLISGVLKNADGSESFVHAKGEVFARTKNKESVVYPLKNKCNITQNSNQRYSLYAFSLKIPFGLKTNGGFLTEATVFIESGKTVLPVGIIREDNLSFYNKTIECSYQEAVLLALSDVVKIKRQEYNPTKLEKVEYKINRKEDEVQVDMIIDCVEDIATEKGIYMEK